MGAEILTDHQVRIEGGRIVAIEPCRGSPDHDLVTAGFVDLQVNGHDDVDVASADAAGWDRLGAMLLAQGVTTWCPTLISAPLAVLDERIETISRRAAEQAAPPRPEHPAPAVAGIHLEGPFLGGAPGAHAHVVEGPIDLDWLSSLPGIVRIVTLGPECVGAIDAIRLLVGRGVVVAMGHTTASFEAASAAIDAGSRLFTHAFNASGLLHQREPGALGAALSDDRIAISVIADGVHVHPAMLRVAWRSKPTGGVALITDGSAGNAARLADVGIALRDGAPRLADGTLAGSALTMPEAVRHVVDKVGVELVEALAAASTVPARLVGLDDRGLIAAGRRADLVALDQNLKVAATWVNGDLGGLYPAGDV